MHKLNHEDRFFVVTGGPGSGKSALLDALQTAGYARSEEAGRAVIQDQMSIGGHALPWDDRILFSELMLCWEMRSYRAAQHWTGEVFFDRGVLDVLGYLRLLGQPVPQHVEKAAETFRYHRSVFITPPWRQIFRQDSERQQNFAEAVDTYDAMVATYTAYGYELIEVPRTPIEERVRFVLARLSLLNRPARPK